MRALFDAAGHFLVWGGRRIVIIEGVVKLLRADACGIGHRALGQRVLGQLEGHVADMEGEGRDGLFGSLDFVRLVGRFLRNRRSRMVRRTVPTIWFVFRDDNDGIRLNFELEIGSLCHGIDSCAQRNIREGKSEFCVGLGCVRRQLEDDIDSLPGGIHFRGVECGGALFDEVHSFPDGDVAEVNARYGDIVELAVDRRGTTGVTLGLCHDG